MTKNYQILSDSELALIRRYREAAEDLSEDMKVNVGIFTGTPGNWEKIEVVQQLVEYFQEHSPELEIATFVVPIPEDPTTASVVRSKLINNIDVLLSRDHDGASLN